MSSNPYAASYAREVIAAGNHDQNRAARLEHAVELRGIPGSEYVEQDAHSSVSQVEALVDVGDEEPGFRVPSRSRLHCGLRQVRAEKHRADRRAECPLHTAQVVALAATDLEDHRWPLG